MSLESVVTEVGKIKCTGTTVPSSPDVEPVGFDFGEAVINESMTFGVPGANSVTVTAIIIRSNYSSVDNHKILLDQISLTPTAVTYNGYVLASVAPLAIVNSEVTSYSTCELDLGNKILLKGASGNTQVALTNGTSPLTMNLVFTISDAGQDSVTAD